MVTALDVAGYVYKRVGWVDAWKLGKLTYFAQAWHLAWDGRPLFDDQFEAWPDGPVVPKLHRVNKFDRREKFGPWGTELPGANPDALSPAAASMVDAVLAFYGDKGSRELVDLTHEDFPWINARGELGPRERSSQLLSTSDLRKCYTQKVVTGDPNIPAAPTFLPAYVAGESYQASVDRQIDKWGKTLSLLAER